MTSTPEAPGRPPSRTGNRSEGGYTLALSALLIIPLIAITAIGVDLGVWYLQAQENQRIADAAALAGVVWLPDQDEAERVATEAVRRNGLDPGVDSTVDITALGRSQLKVSVATKSLLSFSSMFIPEFAVTRAAVAEYNPPVALGSPENQLGNAALWLAVSGKCSVRENGDLRSARYLAGYPGGSYPPANCTGTSNSDYDSDGYLYAVEIPVHPGAPVEIQAFDAAYDPASPSDIEFRPPSEFKTRFTLYDLGGSPFDLAGHSILEKSTIEDRDAGYANSWQTIATISDPQPGTYYLRVEAEGGGKDSFGSNGFALRAATGGTFTSCSTFVDSSCIQVAAISDLSLYASLSGGSSTFYLAEISDDHAGKQLRINLFDVGEGADSVEILDPDGDPVSFTWETDCTVGNPLARGCSGAGVVLDVSGADNQIYADTLSTSRFNDRTVTAKIDIPADYATRYVGNWWQIRYTFGASITDRTTWSIQIIGDPVRRSG
ncbi:MAG: hypothetical protein GY773_24690 [Actinomycetia bacterium]|nr:hypothetical protein [Actinomycetes bacterium]